MLLPFIQEYTDCPGMEAFADKTFVSYETKPGSRVVIHYLKKSEEEEKEGWREEVGGSGFRSYVTFTTCMPSYCTPWLGKSEEEV